MKIHSLSSLCLIILLFSFSPYFTVSSQEIEVSPEIIQNFKTEISQDPSLSQELKNTIDKLLTDTLSSLQKLSKWTQEIESLEKEIQSAPQEIKAIEEQLAQPEKTIQINTKDLSLDQISQNMFQSDAEYKQIQNNFENLQKDLVGRNEYRRILLSKIGELKQKIKELKENSLQNSTTDPPILAKFRELFTNTETKSLEKELEFYNKEIEYFEIKTRLITSRIEKTQSELRQKEKEYEFWKKELLNRKQEEDEKNIHHSINSLQMLIKTGTSFTNELSTFAGENLTLARKRQESDGIESKIISLSDKIKTYNEEYKKQKNQFDTLKQKSKNELPSSGWSFTLRQEKSKLPNINQLTNVLNNYQNELIQIENEYNDLLSRRLKISDIENQITNVFLQNTVGLSEYEKKNVKKSIDELIKTQRNILSSLISDYDTYISLLTDAISILRTWIDHTQQFNTYIDENIIWIRSALPKLETLKKDTLELFSFIYKTNFFKNSYIIYNFILLISSFVLGLIIVIYLCRYCGNLISKVASDIKTPLHFTYKRLFLLILLFICRVSSLSILLLFISILTDTLLSNYQWGNNVSTSIRFLCFPISWFGIIASIFHISPLCEIILKHHSKEYKKFYPYIFVFAFISICLLFLISFSSQFIPISAFADYFFRTTLSIFLLVSVLFFMFYYKFLGKISFSLKDEKTDKILAYIRHSLLYISLVCIILIITNLLGYNYGSLEITKKVFYSIFIMTILSIAYRFMEIPLTYFQWKAILDKSKDSYTSGQTVSSEDKPEYSTNGESQPITKENLFLQIEKAIKYGISIGGIILIFYIWSDIFPALSYLDKIHLWRSSSISEVISTSPIPAENQTETNTLSPAVIQEWVSLLDLIKSLISIIITIVIIKNFSIYLDFLLSKYTNIQSGERYAIITVLKYVLFTIGFIIAMGFIHITWNKVQWLVAALGVGFGFGLQEIVANFVSGLILLFERPLRIGDIVTIGDVSGKVKSLRMRSTAIVNWDNKELIVPNKDLLTQRLINWTRNEPKIRLCIPINVNYNSDVNKVITLLNEIAKSHPFVEHTPEPRAWFLQFGQHALEFELRVFTHIDYYIQLRHDLLLEIHRRFIENHIEISYPQLDIHIKQNGNLKDISNHTNPTS